MLPVDLPIGQIIIDKKYDRRLIVRSKSKPGPVLIDIFCYDKNNKTRKIEFYKSTGIEYQDFELVRRKTRYELINGY